MSTHPTPNSGWLLLMPDGHPYAWYAAGAYPTADSVWQQFEPKTTKRALLVSAGWTVAAGDATSLIQPVLQPHRASA